MSTTHLRFGIPEIELAKNRRRNGQPACFVGQVLVVLFGPTLPESEAAVGLLPYVPLRNERRGNAWHWWTFQERNGSCGESIP